MLTLDPKAEMGERREEEGRGEMGREKKREKAERNVTGPC